MKQFTEEELTTLIQSVKDQAYDEGFEQGFKCGEQYGHYLARGKVANQKRELRRLNQVLTQVYRGFKLALKGE